MDLSCDPTWETVDFPLLLYLFLGQGANNNVFLLILHRFLDEEDRDIAAITSISQMSEVLGRV